jgi:hypothetical protein
MLQRLTLAMPRNMEADIDPDALVVTTVRLPGSLRDELAKQAAKNKRTVSSEIVKRLADSLAEQPQQHVVTQLRNSAAHAAPRAAEIRSAYQAPRSNDHEATLLMLYNQLTAERQLALLTLLRGG